MTTLVVGGGITGLAAALRLQEADEEVLLVESSPRCGGKIQTESRDGFLLEWGPHSIVSTGTELFDFAESLGLDSEIVAASSAAKNRYLVQHGALVRVPRSPLGLFTTPLLSWRERFRALREPFVRSRGEAEESAASFIGRRFGPAIAESFLAPFVCGIYAGDAEQLEMASAFPKIVACEREHGSVIRGLRKTRPKASGRRRGTFGFRSGMETIVHAAASRLGDACRVRYAVRAIRRTDGAFQVELDAGGRSETLSVRSVIVATPARSAAALVEPLCAEFAKELTDVPYAPVGLLQIGVRTGDLPRPLDGFGFLLRPDEAPPLLGCVWSSAVFPNRAPDGSALISAFVGGARTPAGAEPQQLFDDAFETLQSIMGAKFEPVLRAQRWIDRAIPQLNIGHEARVRRIREAESRLPGLILAGGHMDGVSMHDCVSSGWRAAGR